MSQTPQTFNIDNKNGSFNAKNSRLMSNTGDNNFDIDLLNDQSIANPSTSQPCMIQNSVPHNPQETRVSKSKPNYIIQIV